MNKISAHLKPTKALVTIKNLCIKPVFTNTKTKYLWYFVYNNETVSKNGIEIQLPSVDLIKRNVQGILQATLDGKP